MLDAGKLAYNVFKGMDRLKVDILELGESSQTNLGTLQIRTDHETFYYSNNNNTNQQNEVLKLY